MAKTIESIFLDFYDAKKPIINDDLTFTDAFLAELNANNITPDDDIIIYSLQRDKNDPEDEPSYINEYCRSDCWIMNVNSRLFSVSWLNNGEELYASELYEVRLITKTITAYEKID